MKEQIIKEIERIITNPYISESDILYKIKDVYDRNSREDLAVIEPASISDLLSKQLEKIEGNFKDIEFIKTGFSDLDNLLGGFGANEFVIIGGRPAMGKTQLLINLALNISRNIDRKSTRLNSSH